MNKTGIFFIVLALCIGFMPVVFAQEHSPRPDYSHITKSMEANCSEKSINISKKWMMQSAKVAQETNNSPLASPETRLQAQTNKLLATAGYERLISECALWLLKGGNSI